LAGFVGRRQAVACASGTDALQLALLAFGIGAGDEVITTPFTFIATAETIALCGAKPVFVDIEERTFNLDPEKLAGALTARTRAIVAVDLYGHPAAYDEISAFAAEHGLKLIEDAAQSLGADYHGRRCGSFGDLSATSFFPAKPLGCYGDGGMLFTDDEEMAATLRCLRNHGQKKRYYHEAIGCNSRLDTLQAAVLLVKLTHFPEEITRRNQVAETYSRALADNFSIPVVEDDCRSVFAQYTLRSRRRERVLAELGEAGIPYAIHYPVPLHLQPAFAGLGYGPGDFPVAEKIAGEVFSLPMHPFLDGETQSRIIETLKQCTS
ncbi:MAG: DegT/DnrJ/EryC1/StrS family aminotransferase, partial [Deltaproteobacteria bacterium]|nr:DegT/DnrJ/EryC1/StrS family aminotransferase [Deltaproteobacteria bacterium]